MAGRLPPGMTLGTDKGYDTQASVAELRAEGVTPHVAQNITPRRPAIDGRTTRHSGYAVRRQKRKPVEEIFGWLKTVALPRKTRHRSFRRVGCMSTFAAAVYNLVRIRNPGADPEPDLDRGHAMTPTKLREREQTGGQPLGQALLRALQTASDTDRPMLNPRFSAAC